MAFDDLVAGIGEFQRGEHRRKAAHFAALAKGQSPDTFVIACADSRVTPQVMSQAEAGDLFIARNAGNFVPPCVEGLVEGTAATLEYAVLGVGVQHIVILGHSDCGAMKALRDGASEAMPLVQAWIHHGHEARDQVGSGSSLRELTLANIRAQLRNLMTYDFVQTRVASGDLHLHGWYYHIAKGTVDSVDSQGLFRPIAALGT